MPHVLFSPFRAGSAHVVELGPVRVEEIGLKRAPPLSDHPRKQHPQHIGVAECAHIAPPPQMRVSYPNAPDVAEVSPAPNCTEVVSS
jgi:hypothetical protein